MANTYDYSETFESRIQEVRLDGPSIYTSILEMIDNSFDWGEADAIKLDYNESRLILKLSDNGPLGFKIKEAIHRFFTLGKRNEGISSKTIGKFGKGGYKATMNIGNHFTLTSYIDDKSYTQSTDFILMIEKNTQTPTGGFIEHDNKEKQIGSHFTINVRPEYHKTFKTDTFQKHFVRAFHLLPITVKGIINGNEYTPSTESIFNEYMKKVVYNLFWDKDSHKFYATLYNEEPDDSDSDNEENINFFKIGIITLYTLKKVVTKNDYLGEHPGIDFYRNNRLCNTHNPLRNIGSIGENLKAGQLRGGRCHMTFEYENIQLTDHLDVDECVGLTTNKEIPEDTSKFDTSLLQILEEKAKECSKMYESLWKSRKDNLSNSINDDLNKLTMIEKYDDDKLYHDTLDLNKLNKEYKKFKEFKHWKINEEDDGLTYYYYGDKKSIKLAKDNNEDIFQQRVNWPSFVIVDKIIRKSTELIKRKRKYKDYMDKINKKKETLKTDFKISKLIVDLDEYISDKFSGIPEWIDDINICSEDYEYTISILKDIIKKINQSKVKGYFEDILNQTMKDLSHYEELKQSKILEEEEEARIEAEEEKARIEAEEEKARIEAEEEKARIEAEEEKARIEAEKERLAAEDNQTDIHEISEESEDNYVDPINAEDYKQCKKEIQLVKDKYPDIFLDIVKEFIQ